MSAFTIYEWMRHVTEQIPWPREEDKRKAIESIRDWESMNMFGQLAWQMGCSHPELARGVCVVCGRTIEVGRN